MTSGTRLYSSVNEMPGIAPIFCEFVSNLYLALYKNFMFTKCADYYTYRSTIFLKLQTKLIFGLASRSVNVAKKGDNEFCLLIKLAHFSHHHT